MPACGDFGDFGRQLFHALGVDAELRLAGQDFAAQLEQDALYCGRVGHRPAAYSSPTLNRVKRETLMFSPSLAILVLISCSTVRVFSFTNGCS